MHLQEHAVQNGMKLNINSMFTCVCVYKMIGDRIMVIKISLAPDVPEDIKLAQYYQTGWKDLKQG